MNNAYVFEIFCKFLKLYITMMCKCIKPELFYRARIIKIF